MSEVATETEQRIRAAFDAGNLEAAATATLEGYGDEILSFLVSRLRGVHEAQEAFAMFAEDLWVGLPKFAWRCSMRTWAYLLARNAGTRYATSPQRRLGRNLALPHTGTLSNVVERVRSATAIYKQTDVKDRFRALREQLSADDQMLLVLRVDRDMAWRDLAITMGGNAEMDDDEITRESARLRKVFERIKRDLKAMAEKEGLLKRGS